MKRIAVMANCEKARARDVLRSLSARAAEVGLELLFDEATGVLLGAEACILPLPDLFDSVDAVMALGGDGTMLRAVRELDGRSKPVMGFNIGSLGFMTSVAEDAFDPAMECLANEDFMMSERAIACCTVHQQGEETSRHRALNDVVLSRGPSSRVPMLRLTIDDDSVTSYVCDGMVISTPTGSTGHSLSAGGPILSPNTSAFVVSPICPHTLSSRPLVVRDESRIAIEAIESAGELQLTIDGQVGLSLRQGDSIQVTRSAKGVHFIHFPGYTYYGVLRQKLRWRGSSV